MDEIVQSNNRFALDLYARLRQRDGNLFFSPNSLSTALAMTYAGARGKTAEEMERVLHFNQPRERLHESFASLNKTLEAGAGQGYRLSVASRLWGQKGYHFLPEFLTVTRKHYGAELAQVDFAGQTEQTRHRINAWVNEQTQGKIGEAIPADVLDSLTRLVLTNAIYFKGEWTKPFSKEAIREAPFRSTAAKAAAVPMMYQQDDFRYWAGGGFKALEMPFGKRDLAMVVLLPDAIEGLPDLEAKLTADTLSKYLQSLETQNVQVYLPRFEIASKLSLADAFKSMGMTLAFDNRRADFSGISTDDKLFLTALIHNALVTVNEEGTEAAAATGIVVGIKSATRQPPIVFRADHPFVFLIRDNRTGGILFLGRLMNPVH